MAGNPSRDLLTRTTAKTATADRAEETQYLGSMVGKALQQGIVECLGRDRARKTSRPSTAAGEVSRCNGSPCHWVMVSSAERVGLPPCNGSSTLIKITHRCLCNSASDTQHIKSCGDGGVAVQPVGAYVLPASDCGATCVVIAECIANVIIGSRWTTKRL